MPYSTCCGAYTNMEEIGICPECKEHCDFDEYADGEDSLFDWCPKCGKQYDEIDREYQLCSHCKYDAENSKFL